MILFFKHNTDTSSLNLDFTSYTTNNSSTSNFYNSNSNSANFDPFGLGTGFIDSGDAPLKPLNPSQQTSKETSPQQQQQSEVNVNVKNIIHFLIVKKEVHLILFIDKS